MADKKKSNPTARRPSVKKAKPAEPNDFSEKIKELLKRIKSIYSINGKFRAQLVNKKEGGWICEIWSIGKNGNRDRPMLRNVETFATMEEAIEMARKCFFKLTGDNRYFAKEDIWKKNEAE